MTGPSSLPHSIDWHPGSGRYFHWVGGVPGRHFGGSSSHGVGSTTDP